METEIFTCEYFKFGRNTTGLSQSHLRNFLACSINIVIAFIIIIIVRAMFRVCEMTALCIRSRISPSRASNSSLIVLSTSVDHPRS